MASDLDFVNYVIDQLNGVRIITSRKMVGEYMVYINQKPLIGICDNTAYVKILDCIKILYKNNEKRFPYNGAKEHYILDIDNKSKLKKL